MASNWFYAKNGKQLGPVSSGQFKEMARNGQLLATDMIWKEGMASWVQAGSLPDLFPQGGSYRPSVPQPPPLPQPPAYPGPPPLAHGGLMQQGDFGQVSSTSRTVYILLGLFLGGLGVHNFVAGRTGIAIAQLAIFIVSFPLMFLIIGFFTIFIPGIWALVDIITVRHDGQGRLMT